MKPFWFCGDGTEWQRLFHAAADTRFRFAAAATRAESVRISSKAAPFVNYQQPTRIKFPASLKAGRGKAHRGSESGSSKESSSSSSSVSASKLSPKFKACRRRRTGGRRRRRPRFIITRRPSLSPSTPVSSSIPTTATQISWSFRCTAESSVISPQQKLLYSSSSSISFFHRICKKDGRNPSASNDLVESGDKGRARRDRGGARRPHCSLNRTQRPPQQGLYRQRPKRPPSSSLRSHRYPILRRAGPTRLRSTQQSCRLANQEGQSCNRRAGRASRMEPQYFSSIHKFSAAESADERGEREPHWCPPLGGGCNCFW